jgi:hypothetical protein
MGSGISLSKEQVVGIIKRELRNDFNIKQYNKPLYDENGYEIYYDFTDEANYIKTLKKLHNFIKNGNEK